MGSDQQLGTTAPLSSVPIGKSGHLTANRGHEKDSVSSLCVFVKVFLPDLMVNSQVLCQSVPVCLQLRDVLYRV